MLPWRVDKPVGDVSRDGGGKERRLLRYEADLRAQPFDIKRTEVMAVELNHAFERVIKTLHERDNCTAQWIT